MSDYKNAVIAGLSVLVISLYAQAQKQSSVDLTDLVGSFNKASGETQSLLLGLGIFLVLLILVAILAK